MSGELLSTATIHDIEPKIVDAINGSTYAPRRVGVLHGGTSSERAVSFLTSAAVIPELRSQGHEVVECDPTDVDSLAALVRSVDVVFNCLHGRLGEDGHLQGLLTSLGVLNTGSGVLASAIGMDKLVSKQLASALNLRTAETVVAGPGTVFPVIAKPREGGGSIGISVLRDAKELATQAKQWLEETILEPFIEGPIVTVGVLEWNGIGHQLPPIEIELLGELHYYDFQAKYNKGFSRLAPARLSPAHAHEIRCAISSLWNTLTMRGYARFDFIIGSDGPVLLEFNTLPGLQEGSNFVTAASLAGVQYGAILRSLLLETEGWHVK